MLKEDNKTATKDVSLVCETGLGFSQRDKNVRAEEEKGLLDFLVLRNDGSIINLKHLTDLKNIIAKQLPKMPKEYIVRLVFDKKHESMVILKKSNQKVVGGVCYRPNAEQGFIEIAFLAISSLEQVKGYGTRLMNKLKDHCRQNNLFFFLTYADNNAIGYFKKQGFSTGIKMPMEKWKEYIKDYDGGTLMETYCNPEIEYSNLSEIIKQQKEAVKSLAIKFLNVKTRNKFNDLEKQMKISHVNLDDDSTFTIKEKFFNNIPGIKGSGWDFKDYEKLINNEKEGNANFITQCRNIITKLKNNKNSWPFLLPVKQKDAQDYYEIIKEPMDLKTLENGLDSGNYKSRESFVKDIKNIFTNAKFYNKPSSIYHKCAVSLENFIEEDLKNLRDDH